MSIRLLHLAPNFTRVHLPGLTIWFSYDTPIAFRDQHGLVVRQNDWGPTTGKHLNLVDSNKSNRIPGEQFEDRLSLALGGDGAMTAYKTPEQIAEATLRRLYELSVEDYPTAEEAMQRVLDVADDQTASDLLDILVAAIEADRAQRDADIVAEKEDA